MSEEHKEHSHTNYVKIWGILLVLLIVSVVGPMTGIKAIILITAFGIAIVKALMVAGYFMHLNVEKKLAWYMLIATVAFLLVCFFGIAPDVMRSEGTNWKKIPIEKAEPSAAKEDAHH